MICLKFPGHDNRAKETIQWAVIQLFSIIKETESSRISMDLSEDEAYDSSDLEQSIRVGCKESTIHKGKRNSHSYETIRLKTVQLWDMLEMEQLLWLVF